MKNWPLMSKTPRSSICSASSAAPLDKTTLWKFQKQIVSEYVFLIIKIKNLHWMNGKVEASYLVWVSVSFYQWTIFGLDTRSSAFSRQLEFIHHFFTIIVPLFVTIQSINSYVSFCYFDVFSCSCCWVEYSTLPRNTENNYIKGQIINTQ